MANQDTGLEALQENDVTRLNAIIVEAGVASTRNHAIFCIGVWKMYEKQPWALGDFRVEDREITSWYSYRMYLAERSGGYYSPNNIDNAVKRIEFLVQEKTEWIDIIRAISLFPVAIDDMRDGGATKTPVRQLVGELAALPAPSEARKRVAEEQGKKYIVAVSSEMEGHDMVIQCQQFAGTELITPFSVTIRNWARLNADARQWILKKAFKVRENERD